MLALLDAGSFPSIRQGGVEEGGGEVEGRRRIVSAIWIFIRRYFYVNSPFPFGYFGTILPVKWRNKAVRLSKYLVGMSFFSFHSMSVLLAFHLRENSVWISPPYFFLPSFFPSHGTCLLGCVGASVDGQWQEWSSWSDCSVTCANGTQQRTRQCSAAAHGGSECRGHWAESRECHNPDCTGKILSLLILYPLWCLNSKIMNLTFRKGAHPTFSIPKSLIPTKRKMTFAAWFYSCFVSWKAASFLRLDLYNPLRCTVC